MKHERWLRIQKHYRLSYIRAFVGVLLPLFHFHLRPQPDLHLPLPRGTSRLANAHGWRSVCALSIASDAEQWRGMAASAGGSTVRRQWRQRVGYSTERIRSWTSTARLVPRPCRRGPDGENRRGRAVHEVLRYHLGTGRIDCGIGRK